MNIGVILMGKGTINMFRGARVGISLAALALASGCALATDPTVPLYDMTGKTPERVARDERICTDYARKHVGAEFAKGVAGKMLKPKALIGLPFGYYSGDHAPDSQEVLNGLYVGCGRRREEESKE